MATAMGRSTKIEATSFCVYVWKKSVANAGTIEVDKARIGVDAALQSSGPSYLLLPHISGQVGP